MALSSDSNAHEVVDDRRLTSAYFALIALVCIHVAVCCVSLFFIAIIYPEYHIFYRPEGLPSVVAIIAAFALFGAVFVFADFSFGYLVGFYLYTMIVSYLWLNFFSEFVYNHQLAGLSAAASAVAFLLPALFIRSPLRQIWTLTPKAFDYLLNLILLFAVAALAAGAHYNFRLVWIDDIYTYRDNLSSPTIVNYSLGIVSNALLPFAFACFAGRRSYWRAAAVLLLLLCFYPITLSKLALFTPIWLIAMLLLARILDLRVTVIFSLLAPMLVGMVLFVLFRHEAIPYKAAIPYFGLINFRMVAIPALAMDYYNTFFFKHDLTYFCQISFLKPLIPCPYQEPLAIVIYNAFGIGGNFNASLFATEGIASVGLTFAPVSAFVCGLVIALGNRMSAGLNPQFILVSGAIFPQTLLNIPFTTVLLTHGALVLFLLWYVTPRQALDSK